MIERFLRRLTVRGRIVIWFIALALLLALPIPLLVADRLFLVDRLQQVTDVEARAERLLLRVSTRVESSRVNLARYLQDFVPSATEALDDVEQAIQFLTEAQDLITPADQKTATTLVLAKLVDHRALIGDVIDARGEETGQSFVRLVFEVNRLGNEIGQQIEQIVRDSEARVAEANQNVFAETQRRLVFLIASYVGVLISGLALAIAVARSITRPVAELREGAEAFRQGQMDTSIPVAGTDELSLLARTFNQLTTELSASYLELEQRVAERTQELGRRTALLEASAEISQAATSILETDRLLRQVVELIRERLNLYYVGLFQVDHSHMWAVLQAGTGEAGRAMLARGHRIRIGEGMIGWCIAHAQGRIAPFAEEDAVRLDTKELPHTRSEAALPLRSRGQILGALTIQDTRPNAFDEDTITVLQTMADQVAVALDNARLFAASQAALEAERRAYGQLSREAWSALLRARPDWGYRYSQKSISSVDGPWRPDMLQAARSGQSIQENDVDNPTLTVPLKVRDQVVGVLSFDKDERGARWTIEETALLETLADQLGLALEAAQLYFDSQRRAQREQLQRQIIEKVRAAPDIDAIARTAAEELVKGLGGARGFVKLSPSRLNDE